jgi:uncharacterized protein (DUF58 family)
MLLRRKTRPTPEGWYYLVVMGFLLAGALLREINLLLLVFGLMVAALLLSWRHVAKSLKKLEFRRESPPTVCAGEPLMVDVHAANRRGRGVSWAVVVQDTVRRVGHGEEPLRAKTLFARLGPREEQTQAYQGKLIERGRYQLGPLRVTTRFPLGLLQRTEIVDERSTLLVLPRRGRLTPRWRQREYNIQQGNRSVKHRQGLAEGDFHSLRDYRPGDSRSHIHWRTSARRGELMVRQFERQQNQDLLLVLELWQPQKPSREQRDNVELAVSFAATIVSDQCRRGGSQIHLLIAGKEDRTVRGPASMALLGELLEALALAEGSAGDALPEVLAQGVAQMPSRAELALLSTRRVDLGDAVRYAAVRSDPRWPLIAQRLLVVDASSEKLLEYFEPV